MRNLKLAIAIVLLTCVAGRLAAVERQAVDEAISKSLPSLIEFRHEMHRNPELGNREVETAAKVAAELRVSGVEVKENIAHTGVVGVLHGTKPGPVVALRADMDALPMPEATDLEFKSQNENRMHACGHDVHVAGLLGAARLLAEGGRPDQVPFEMSGELLFPGGVSASLFCSFRIANQQWANVSGTRGLVHVPDFVLGVSHFELLGGNGEPEYPAQSLSRTNAGVAEAIVSPRSELIGKTMNQVKFKEIYGLNPVLLSNRIQLKLPVDGNRG